MAEKGVKLMKSNCCNANVFEFEGLEITTMIGDEMQEYEDYGDIKWFVCQNCHKPCKLIKENKEQK